MPYTIEDISSFPLTSQQIYDIINACLEAAEDNGFLNRYVFDCAIFCHLVLNLIEDLDEIDGPMVAENPVSAFDHFLKKGYLNQLVDNYKVFINRYFLVMAKDYFNDYKEYLLSIGGVLNKAEIFSSQVLQNMAGQVNEVMQNDDIKKTLHIADE